MLDLLPPKMHSLSEMIGNISAELGASSYLVGGTVRDLLLGRPSVDMDIMVQGDAVQLAETFARRNNSRPTLHGAFGTATCMAEGYRVDFSTCRNETYAHPGALPRVKPGTIQEDLFRRDFTVNAMALGLPPRETGLLIDLYGGKADLANRLLRVLHDGSFVDDATRIMRAVRYGQRLGFKLEKRTARLVSSELEMLDTIGGGRLRNEVILWLDEDMPGSIIREASRRGVLQKLHPSLTWSRAMGPAFGHAAAEQDSTRARVLRFCLLCYGLAEDGLYELLQRLDLTGTHYDLLSHQALDVRNLMPRINNPSIKKSDLYFILSEYDPLAIEVNLLYPNPPSARSNLRLYMRKLRHTRVLLGGAGLVKIGIKPGPQVGSLLRQLLAARLDGLVKTRADEEVLAHRLAGP